MKAVPLLTRVMNSTQVLQYLLATGVLTATASAQAQTPTPTGTVEDCLRREVVKAENSARTVAQLRTLCSAVNPAPVSSSGSSAALRSAGPADEPVIDDISVSSPPAPQGQLRLAEEMDNPFFQPYKTNYIVFGSMQNQDGGDPFSGKTLDIKFELGMQFSLFPQLENFQALTPLKFGYSQRSWWDIAESSAPFKEHNYNPEVFWDFREALARPSDRTRLHIFDLAGFEHQSNGLAGADSRSWDRVYVQRELRLSEMYSWTVKLWHVVNKGDFNADIEDYLGNAEINTHIDLNNWARIDLKTRQGKKTSKISYQVDLILPMSRWVNSNFVLSYYNGYGEALVSYDRKTTSLRGGFYFPLGF